LKKLQEEYETNRKLFHQHEKTVFGLIEELESYGAIEEAYQIAIR
jgi:hypothetical protein